MTARTHTHTRIDILRNTHTCMYIYIYIYIYAQILHKNAQNPLDPKTRIPKKGVCHIPFLPQRSRVCFGAQRPSAASPGSREDIGRSSRRLGWNWSPGQLQRAMAGLEQL